MFEVVANTPAESGIMGLVIRGMRSFSDLIFTSAKIGGVDVPLVVLGLIVSAIIFTIYFNFINFRAFKHAFHLVRGDYSDPKDHGEISHFSALCTALSGTVGVGNIGAVAMAIFIGGPGACFWIIVAGLFGMTTKFLECTLGVKYREENEDKSISGGPMHYLEKGLSALGFKRLGKTLGIAYAFAMTVGCLGTGNMFQSNQAFEQFVVATGGENSFFADKGWLFGLILAALVAMVIIGGIKSIARVTSKLVPLMAVLYTLAVVTILTYNIDYIPLAISTILKGAFMPGGVTGGAVYVIFLGFKRAVFSNEAGMGSSAIAHSAVKTAHPVSEGIVGLLEPFIDTVVICTLTAMVIVTTMVSVPEFNDQMSNGGEALMGIKLTSAAIQYKISWGPYFLSMIAIMFAISTLLSWSYYGLQSWIFLVGSGKKRETFYNLFFCSFIVLGCMLKLDVVIDFSDALVYFLCIPNIIGLYFLAPVVKRELNDYLLKLKNKEIVSSRES